MKKLHWTDSEFDRTYFLVTYKLLLIYYSILASTNLFSSMNLTVMQKNCQSISQGEGHKIWPRAASRPRPGLEDYITMPECTAIPDTPESKGDGCLMVSRQTKQVMRSGALTFSSSGFSLQEVNSLVEYVACHYFFLFCFLFILCLYFIYNFIITISLLVGVVSGSLYRRTHSLSGLAWSWVGGRLAPFYIHQMNRVNSRNGSAMKTAP